MPRSSLAFRWFSVATVLLTLGVIVWGAFVRATGSGAGCGDHWPMCNGELMPRAPSTQTLIELTHRLTSGLSGLAVVVLTVWAFRVQAQGAGVRRAAAWSLFFMLTEGGFGALLVKLELVANNATASRAVAMSIHSINTFSLLAALGSTVFFAWFGGGRLQWRGTYALLVGTCLTLLLGVALSGTVAALGDTLVQQSVFNPFVELLIRLRIVHPLVAIAAVAAMVFTVIASLNRPAARRFALAWAALFVMQVLAGLINVVLQAPVWLQLIHLLLADLVWLGAVLVAHGGLSVEVESGASRQAVSRVAAVL